MFEVLSLNTVMFLMNINTNNQLYLANQSQSDSLRRSPLSLSQMMDSLVSMYRNFRREKGNYSNKIKEVSLVTMKPIEISEKSTNTSELFKSLLATRNEKRKKINKFIYSFGSTIDIFSFGSTIEMRSLGSTIDIFSFGSTIEMRSLGSTMEIFWAFVLSVKPTNTSKVAKIFMAI